MNGIAKVIVVGNLGRRPALRHTTSGKAVGDFSVAVNSGRDDDPTEWIKVVVWEKTAEACEKYLDKGSQVYVEGRWHTNKWTDKDGNERSMAEVIAHKVLFIGKPGAGAQGGGERPAEGQGDSTGDDPIPF
ncbi:hypothetical protein LCGC14_0258220 [marine sediment metagenome]|uniref:Single-stranded DNA-binding protein n=1 Tax=marine sediment metagenome TaxID=412755 RepID=A0A0F9X733_9ZZZZ